MSCGISLETEPQTSSGISLGTESKTVGHYLNGQRFPKFRPIFKINIFGHGTWRLKKVHMYFLYPTRLKLSLLLLYMQQLSRYMYMPNVKTTILCKKCGVQKQVLTLFLPPNGSKLSIFSLYMYPLSRNRRIFTIAMLHHRQKCTGVAYPHTCYAKDFHHNQQGNELILVALPNSIGFQHSWPTYHILRGWKMLRPTRLEILSTDLAV